MILALSEKTRWVIFFLGCIFVLLGILDHKGVLNNHPVLEYIVFPYIWVLGLIFVFVGYGFPEENKEPSGSGGVDGAPSATKKGPFGDGSFWGDGGGSSGGGD